MSTTHQIRQMMLTGWNWIRWIRLAAGIFLITQSIHTHDLIAGFIASILLFQAITNTGCCGVSTCAVNKSNDNELQSSEVEYEEIVDKRT